LMGCVIMRWTFVAIFFCVLSSYVTSSSFPNSNKLDLSNSLSFFT